MSTRFKQIASSFKRTYDFSKVSKINWFPGHMTKGLRQMQHAMLKTDCIIEIHDARIPLSGRNLAFRSHVTGSARPHILVLNKEDLAFPSQSEQKKEEIKKVILKNDAMLTDVVFTNCKNTNCQGLHSILPTAVELIKSGERYHRSGAPDSNVMIIGVPNVGKSSLINLIRSGTLRVKGNLRVGACPGVTRAVETKIRVNNDPLVFMLDTPGIMMPNVADKHIGMKLACCGTLKDSVVGEQLICDYALHLLNKTDNFSYVDVLRVDEPTEDSRILLAKLAINEKMMFYSQHSRSTKPDLQSAAAMFLRLLRAGKFGPVIFDEDILRRHCIQ